MVSCLYDPAIHYSNDEYYRITNMTEDIQTRVETPKVYIVARSGSSDVEQLAYINTRLESIKVKTNLGTNITNIMRFFHGDSPARRFESGQQKGGNYYCSGCGANAQWVYELDYCFHCPYMSLTDRQQLVLDGPFGRKNSQAKTNKPLQNLKKQELIQELNARGIYDEEKKKELGKLLSDKLHGFQRVFT